MRHTSRLAHERCSVDKKHLPLPQMPRGGGLTDVCTSQEVCRALYPLGTGSLLQLPSEEDGVGQSKASRLSAGGTPSPSDCGDRPGAEVGQGAGGGAFC